MAKKINFSEVEKNWQVEEDVRTLERYQELINDKKRLSEALKKAKENMDNLKERADALSRTISKYKGK